MAAPSTLCGLCGENIRTDGASRILRHTLPDSPTECLGANIHVTDWATPEDRLRFEQGVSAAQSLSDASGGSV